jgi:hypothetical protein
VGTILELPRSGSINPIESGFKKDPDPRHWYNVSTVELYGSVLFEEQIREERLAESFPCLEVNLLEFVPGQVDPSNTSGHGGETASHRVKRLIKWYN